MSIKELFRDDLLNRYPAHTFTETVTGSLTLVEFKDGADALVASALKVGSDAAYLLIREDLVGHLEVLPCVTTAQRDALTDVAVGLDIFNLTDDSQEIYDGTQWLVTTPVGSAMYNEAFESAGTTASAGWVTIPVPTPYTNSSLTIVIHNDSTGSQTAGIRAVGSILERKFLVTKDSALSMVVITDANGDFEIYSSGSSSVTFTIVGVIG